MNTAQWLLNLALLGWVLVRNVGTHRITPTTFVVPAVVVALVGATYLRDLPTTGHDGVLELVGAGAGVLLGALSAALTRVGRRGEDVVVTAGVAFAALWVGVIGGRVAFAEWATHAGARTVGEFSMRHQITGADAWTAAFVLLAVAMVLSRYAVTGATVLVRARRTQELVPAGEPA